MAHPDPPAATSEYELFGIAFRGTVAAAQGWQGQGERAVRAAARRRRQGRRRGRRSARHEADQGRKRATVQSIISTRPRLCSQNGADPQCATCFAAAARQAELKSFAIHVIIPCTQKG